MEPSSIEKVLEIDEHIGCAMSGMTADARTMIDHARVVAQVRIFIFDWDSSICLGSIKLTCISTSFKNHTFTYDEKIKVESITQGVCDLALRFSDSATGEKASMVSWTEFVQCCQRQSLSVSYIRRDDHLVLHYSLLVLMRTARNCKFCSGSSLCHQ